jgi:pimeloyl-ACP methyl ester carboxylesterase
MFCYRYRLWHDRTESVVVLEERMKRRGLVVLLAALLAALAAPGPASAAAPKPKPPKLNPVIFVHGFVGSGAQFESQQQRFTSNGYPQRLIGVLEYDSTFGLATREQVFERLDALIARMQRRSGRPQVDLLGHSLGTSVLQEYLATPERAGRVAHYVNLDGRTATAPPGGVPTLAVWAGVGTPGRTITGATNVTIPNQTHVQVATSARTFRAVYRFLRGRRPETTRVVPRRGRFVRVAGRAVLFPQNAGATNATLRVWKLAPLTGRHVGGVAATKQLTGDGSWGPFKLERGAHYEFAITRPGSGTHHLYYEPFRRDDHLVRLLTAEPNTGLDALTTKGEGHVVVIITRNKELWGDQGAQNDVLTINGTNVINAATSPQSKRTIGLFAFDAGADGQSNLSAPLPTFFALPFISGVDLAIPAAQQATGRVSVRLRSRGRGPVRAINFPNLPSSTDRISVHFNDYE